MEANIKIPLFDENGEPQREPPATCEIDNTLTKQVVKKQKEPRVRLFSYLTITLPSYRLNFLQMYSDNA